MKEIRVKKTTKLQVRDKVMVPGILSFAQQLFLLATGMTSNESISAL